MKNTELQNTPEAVVEPKILHKDHYAINYYGQLIGIKHTKKILCLFISGAGRNYGYDYVGYATFELYVCDKFKNELVQIGYGSTNYDGDDISCKYRLWHQQEVTVQGFTLEDVFMKIQNINS
jgi:hypothetical protein